MRYFKRTNGDYARIGRFTWNLHSPEFGKYYIDFRDVTGRSLNDNEVPCGVSLEDCLSWPRRIGGFTEIENPILVADG